MKTTLYLLISIFAFISCEKKETDTINKKLLIGTWEEIDIDSSFDCTDYLEFNNESYRTQEICPGNSLIGFFREYAIDGKNILVDGEVLYEIEYISPTLLKLNDSQGIFHEYKKP